MPSISNFNQGMQEEFRGCGQTLPGRRLQVYCPLERIGMLPAIRGLLSLASHLIELTAQPGAHFFFLAVAFSARRARSVRPVPFVFAKAAARAASAWPVALGSAWLFPGC